MLLVDNQTRWLMAKCRASVLSQGAGGVGMLFLFVLGVTHPGTKVVMGLAHLGDKVIARRRGQAGASGGVPGSSCKDGTPSWPRTGKKALFLTHDC